MFFPFPFYRLSSMIFKVGQEWRKGLREYVPRTHFIFFFCFSYYGPCWPNSVFLFFQFSFYFHKIWPQEVISPSVLTCDPYQVSNLSCYIWVTFYLYSIIKTCCEHKNIRVTWKEPVIFSMALCAGGRTCVLLLRMVLPFEDALVKWLWCLTGVNI